LAVAFVLAVTSDHIVSSKRVADPKMPPFKFQRPPLPKKDISQVNAAPTSAGDLDSTFGTDGKLITDFSSIEYASAVAVQTDGKVVAAGTVSLAGTPNIDYDFAVFRYNPNGSLDTSFDSDGKVITPISNDLNNNYDAAYAAAIQTDGKIVVAGLSDLGGGLFALVRYNSDGSLDTSFGSGGIMISTTIYGAIFEIAIQPDGKIVAAGSNFTIARYNPNGSLDASFGTGGIVTTNFGMDLQTAYSVAVQTDGKIVATGDTALCDEEGYCYFDVSLARYNQDGSLDTSFDTDGRVILTFGSSDESANAVVLQTDGKIVTAGYSVSTGVSFAIARFNGDGSLDSSFDGDGKVTIDIGPYNYCYSASLQPDGKIVVSGGAWVGSSYDLALARLNPNGSLDVSFDTDGIVTTTFGGEHEFAYDTAIQPDGRIAAAGSANDDFALALYNVDGSLDTAFDGDGKVTTSLIVASSAVNAVTIDERQGFDPRVVVAGYSNNGANDDFAIATNTIDGGLLSRRITPIGNSNDRANAAAIYPSGPTIVAGYTDNGVNTDFALVRYFGNSALDNWFGTNGKVTTDFGGNNDEATAVAVLPDFRIVVLGRTIVNGSSALALARYNNDGLLDASFGTGGKVIVQSLQNAKAMAIQPDGKIIAGGSAPHSGPPPFAENFAVARFNSDGSLDTSFDTDGIAVVRFSNPSQINALALQPYGKIVAAGFTRNSNDSTAEFALARLLPNGSLDTSFDADGKVTTSFDVAQSYATSVRPQRNGKIVAAGFGASNPTSADFALARYNVNGSLDATFSTDGKQTTDFFGSDDIAFAAAIQRDGNIVAAGSASHGAKHDFAVARYIGDATQRTINNDYDGDGLADVGVFRPSNSVWYLDRSTEGFFATQWGSSADKITPADFDGDGKTDIAVFRDGIWNLRTGLLATPGPIHFGSPGDIPVPGDYSDGDGRAELAVYRNGVWWSVNLRSHEVNVVQFGLPTDKPVPADYDGDGRVDQAVYRNGEWHINRSSLGYTVVRFGIATDTPVAADYDGDGKADFAVYRDGTWYLLQTSQGFSAFQWGLPSDVPAPADYDGDGKTDAAVFRNGIWYINQTGSGISIRQFGLANDKPVASAYLP
jgi:uncharacterized delta-60 repeat protein